MLVSFEGQDGAGKTALLTTVHGELQRQGLSSAVVEEFSQSPYGQRLTEAVARDKFLRPVGDEEATLRTRALEIVADLYYQDEREIGPALQQGHVVLKDRHLDTIFYTLTPSLIDGSAERDENRGLTWLNVLCSELRHRPALTVYVDAPLALRVQRIHARQRHLQEERPHEVSPEDIEVFAARERIVRQLMRKEPSRFLVLDNSRPLIEGATAVIKAIRTQLASSSRKG